MVSKQSNASVKPLEERKQEPAYASTRGNKIEGEAPKEVKYCLPGVKIGQGKFGPIELIIYKGELHALKRIPKASIDKAKRIEHLKNEKKVN